jgi:hypothetical protein
MAEEELTLLGQPAKVPATPQDAVLERVANPQAVELYVVRFTCPEFTCLCPVTGQPDFAHFVIDYVPQDHLLESKSLKLFLAAFRSGFASPGIGIPAAASRSTSSIRPPSHPRDCGCPNRGSSPTAAGGEAHGGWGEKILVGGSGRRHRCIGAYRPLALGSVGARCGTRVDRPHGLALAGATLPGGSSAEPYR